MPILVQFQHCVRIALNTGFIAVPNIDPFLYLKHAENYPTSALSRQAMLSPQSVLILFSNRVNARVIVCPERATVSLTMH